MSPIISLPSFLFVSFPPLPSPLLSSPFPSPLLSPPLLSSLLQANEMLLSGRKLTAQEACAKGLVSQVLWPGTFMQEVMVRIRELVSCNSIVSHPLFHLKALFFSVFICVHGIQSRIQHISTHSHRLPF